jgi:hypothetical protein
VVNSNRIKEDKMGTFNYTNKKGEYTQRWSVWFWGLAAICAVFSPVFGNSGEWGWSIGIAGFGAFCLIAGVIALLIEEG